MYEHLSPKQNTASKEGIFIFTNASVGSVHPTCWRVPQAIRDALHHLASSNNSNDSTGENQPLSERGNIVAGASSGRRAPHRSESPFQESRRVEFTRLCTWQAHTKLHPRSTKYTAAPNELHTPSSSFSSITSAQNFSSSLWTMNHGTETSAFLLFNY